MRPVPLAPRAPHLAPLASCTLVTCGGEGSVGRLGNRRGLYKPPRAQPSDGKLKRKKPNPKQPNVKCVQRFGSGFRCVYLATCSRPDSPEAFWILVLLVHPCLRTPRSALRAEQPEPQFRLRDWIGDGVGCTCTYYLAASG